MLAVLSFCVLFTYSFACLFVYIEMDLIEPRLASGFLHLVAQVGFTPDPPASVFQIVGLQECSTVPTSSEF